MKASKFTEAQKAGQHPATLIAAAINAVYTFPTQPCTFSPCSPSKRRSWRDHGGCSRLRDDRVQGIY